MQCLLDLWYRYIVFEIHSCLYGFISLCSQLLFSYCVYPSVNNSCIYTNDHISSSFMFYCFCAYHVLITCLDVIFIKTCVYTYTLVSYTWFLCLRTLLLMCTHYMYLYSLVLMILSFILVLLYLFLYHLCTCFLENI